MYGKYDSLTLYDVEALLYVQEAQLDKFKQELVLSNIFSNLAVSHSKENAPPNRGDSNSRGCGYGYHGRRRGRVNPSSFAKQITLTCFSFILFYF